MAAAKNVDAGVVKDDVLEVMEATLDTIEDSLDLIEGKISWAARNRTVLVCGAILLGVSATSAVTYLVVSKRLMKKYQAMADEQVEDVKRTYRMGEKPPLETLAERYETTSDADDISADSVKPGDAPLSDPRAGAVNYNGVRLDPAAVAELTEEVVSTPVAPTPEPVEIIESNIFVTKSTDPNFDIDREMVRREEHPDRPFVITVDEFNENETDAQQEYLTFYEEDGVLTDPGDHVIADVDTIVGDDNIVRFGHGSNDPHIVFVRNPKLHIDYEITRSMGSYSEEVLGLEKDLTHSNGISKRERRRRFADE